MQRKYLNILVVVAFLVGLFPVTVYAAEPQPIISGNSISITTANGDIKVTPHTLTASGWVTVEFQSRSITGDVDVGFGFNGYDQVQTIKNESWQSYEHTLSREVDAVITTVYKPAKVKNIKQAKNKSDIGDELLNSNKAEIDVDEIDFTTKQTKPSTKTIAYDSYNALTGEFTYKYNGKKTEYYPSTFVDWKQNSNPKNTEYVAYKGSNKWEHSKYEQIVNQNTWYTTRFWVDIPFKGKQVVSGKYNVSVKPSSLTLSNAILQNKAIVLDPWYSASWAYRKSMVLHLDDATQTNYQVKITVHYGGADASDVTGAFGAAIVHTPNASVADFDDLRFTTSDGSTLCDYWIESKTDSTSAVVWVEVPTVTGSSADTTIYMYYGNAGASAASNGTNTFIIFDDFETGANGDTVGGSWTEQAAHVHISTEYDIGDIAGYTGTRSVKLVNNDSMLTMPITVSSNIAIRHRYYKPAASFIIGCFSDGSHQTQSRLADNENIYTYSGGVDVDTTLNCSADAWGLIEYKDIVMGTSTTIVCDGVTKTGAVIDQAADAWANKLYFYGVIAPFWIDDVIVRKYTANEPTWGSFGAEAAGASSVSTISSSSYSNSTATVTGNITSVGGYGYVQSWGTQYGTATGTYTANVTNTGNKTAWYLWNDSLTGLTSGTKYFYRAFAYNPVGYGYGSEMTFLTLPNPPTAATGTAGSGSANITWTKATGGAGITVWTVVRYNTGAYPTDPNTSGTLAYNGTAESNTTYGLVNGTTYLFSLWTIAYNADPLSHYSSTYAQVGVTPVGTPTAYTSQFTGLGRDYAVVNGNVTSFGGAAGVSEYGFDYGLTVGYGSSQTNVSTLTTPQAFYKNLTGLLPATVYHYRAKVYNGIWGYGQDMTFSTKGSPVIFENLNTGDDAYGNITSSANVSFQTFTTNSTIAHTVTAIKLFMGRALAPGNIKVSIRHTAGGIPTGEDLISVTASANGFSTGYTWETFTPSTEYSLEANTMYAIVLQAPSGDNTNYVRWRLDAGGGIAGGNSGFSSTGGATWESYTGDYLFEIWGNPALELVNAKVFRSYITSGDWLVVCSYKNKYPPYYSDDTSNEKDVSALFNLQLINPTGGIIASTKVAQWAYEPGSIYLSPTSITPLTWGSLYRVRIQGNFGALPYSEYELQPADWVGSDLTKLDSYCLSLATLMETYYSTTATAVTLTTYVTGTGKMLNRQGGVMFETGIPQLSKIRPNLFSIATAQGMPNTQQTWTNALQGQYIWQAQLGPELTATLTAVGNVINVDGKIAGMILCFILYLLIAAATFPRGHVVAGLVLSFPILLAGAWIGVIDLAVVGVVTFIMVALLMFYLWWRNAY